MTPSTTFGRIDHERTWLSLAVLVWSISFVVVCALVLRGGTYNTITYDVYVTAARHWWARAPLYDLGSVDDFQYLPHAAVLFSPFVTPIGGLAWRALCWGLYAHGVWRMARHLAPERAGKVFLIATAFAVGPSIDSLGIGQCNLLVAALTLQVAADLIAQRFWRAAALLAVGLAAKPLIAVWLLLVWALYPPMRWHLPIALALAFALPFLVGEPTYVLAQYQDFVSKSRTTANPGRLFEDVNGLVTTLGLAVSYRALLVARIVAALGVLALGAHAKKALREPRATLVLAGLAVAYLVLFNPRTQTNSYAIPASLAALMMAIDVLDRRWRAAAGTLVVLLCWSGNSHAMVWPEYWLKPLACVLFGALLVHEIFRKPLTRAPPRAVTAVRTV